MTTAADVEYFVIVKHTSRRSLADLKLAGHMLSRTKSTSILGQSNARKALNVAVFKSISDRKMKLRMLQQSSYYKDLLPGLLFYLTNHNAQKKPGSLTQRKGYILKAVRALIDN